MKNQKLLNTKIYDVLNILSKGVDFDDYSVQEEVCFGYNFKYYKGALTNANGLEDLSIRVSSTSANVKTLSLALPSKIFAYSSVVLNKSSILAMDIYNNLYKNDVDSFSSEFTKITQFDSLPNIIKISTLNENFVLFSSASKLNVYSGGYGLKTIDSSCKILDVCMHNGVMFLIKDQEVRHIINWFPDINPDNIPINIMTANSIAIPDDCGNIIKILSFNDYLYVFCEYGIFRVVSYESKKKQYVEPVYMGSSRIFPQTIALSGGDIIFTSESGIYSFSGLKVEKIDVKISSLLNGVDNSNAKAVFGNDKYYLACKLNYADNKVVGAEDGGYVNNTLLVVDTENKSVVINRGICLKDLSTYFGYENHKIMCVSKRYSPALKQICENGKHETDYPLKKKCVISQMTFGDINSTKVIKRIFVKTNALLQVNFEGDKYLKTLTIKPSDCIQNIPVNIKGKVFNVSVECEKSEIKVDALKLQVGEYA